jgi:hypothetical protein
MSRDVMQKAFEIIGVLKPDNFVHRELQGEAWDALRAALSNYEEPLPPVDIGVDVTPEGTHVTAFYRRPDAVQEMFYSQFHPLTKPEMPTKIFGPNLEQILNAAGFYRREWVGLTNEELIDIREIHEAHIFQIMFAVEAKIREKNNANS